MKREILPGKLRTLLGIRRRRALLPAGSMPQPGARIFSGHLRLTVQPGMPPSLWNWLQNLGWRMITYRPDRRRYDDISEVWTRLLNEAPPEERARVLMQATEAARKATPHPRAYLESMISRQARWI